MTREQRRQLARSLFSRRETRSLPRRKTEATCEWAGELVMAMKICFVNVIMAHSVAPRNHLIAQWIFIPIWGLAFLIRDCGRHVSRERGSWPPRLAIPCTVVLLQRNYRTWACDKLLIPHFFLVINTGRRGVRPRGLGLTTRAPLRVQKSSLREGTLINNPRSSG